MINTIGWLFFGGYKNILPSMLTISPSSSTRAILLTSLAIYSCIPRKRAIQYYIIIFLLIKTGNDIISHSLTCWELMSIWSAVSHSFVWFSIFWYVSFWESANSLSPSEMLGTPDCDYQKKCELNFIGSYKTDLGYITRGVTKFWQN